MSDYLNQNVHRGDGVPARGIMAAIGVVVFVVILLASLGANNAPPSNEATAPVVVPATENAPVAAPVASD